MIDYQIDDYSNGLSTVISYATVAISNNQKAQNKERSEMLLRFCEELKKQIALSSKIHVNSFEDEDNIMVLIAAAENYIEEQVFSMISTDVHNNQKNIEQLRKDHTTVKSFYNALKNQDRL